MRNKITVLACLAMIMLAATAFAQSDTGTPDTVKVEKLVFAAAPWPEQIDVVVHIFSDNNIAGWALGLRPIGPDSSNFTAITPTGYTHAASAFNTSTGTPFWSPFRYDAGKNAGLVGWADFAAGATQSPQGEMFTLQCDVETSAITAGMKVEFDTTSLNNGGLIEVQYKEGTSTASRPVPWRPDPTADIILAVEERSASTLPTSYSLEQNVPNPFNPETQIDFAIPKSGHVHIDIYNTLGQKVKTLVDEPLSVGSKRVSWDGTDDRGKQVASGVYFYRMSVNDFSATKKMLLLK